MWHERGSEGPMSEVNSGGKLPEGRRVSGYTPSFNCDATTDFTTSVGCPACDGSATNAASSCDCTIAISATNPTTDRTDTNDAGEPVPPHGCYRFAAVVELIPSHVEPEPLDRQPVATSNEVYGEHLISQPNFKMTQQVVELSRLLAKRRKTPVEYWRSVKASKQVVRHAMISEMERDTDRRPHATIKINGEAVRGLLDSGASISCLGKGAWQTIHRCALKWKELGDHSAVETASGQQQKIVGYVDTRIQFQGTTNKIRLYIIPTLKNELYLGIDFWHSFELLPELEELSTSVTEQAETGIDVESPDVHLLSPEQRIRLNEIIALYPSSHTNGLGKTTLLQHSINVANASPCKQRFRPVSPAVESRMFAEIDRMLALGVVEESTSAWSSPMALVPKAGGKWRLCLDARQLNALTVKAQY